MSYGYTDEDGVRLHVDDYATNSHIYVHAEGSPPLGILLPHEDAPALALAILEAAGVTDKNDGGKLGAACLNLRGYVQSRKAEAEREAEDAKVDEYRRLLPVLDPYEGISWADMTENGKQMHRDRYRAAREFFAKEDTPAPRVLNYGDPEPERDTRWRDRMGDIWFYGAKSWKFAKPGGTVSESDYHRWDELTSYIFPMTEVTGDAR